MPRRRNGSSGCGSRAFTDGPDAEVGEAVAERFERLAAALRAVHEEIAEELAALTAQGAGGPAE